LPLDHFKPSNHDDKENQDSNLMMNHLGNAYESGSKVPGRPLEVDLK